MQEWAGLIISKLLTLCSLLLVRVSFALILLKYIFHAILSNDIHNNNNNQNAFMLRWNIHDRGHIIERWFVCVC